MRVSAVVVGMAAVLLVMGGCSKSNTTEPDPAASKVPSGPAYLGVAGSGLVRIAADGSAERIGPAMRTFYDLRAAPDGTVYAATLDGFFRIADKDVSKVDLGSHGDVLHLDFAADGTLIAATYSELLRRDGESWSTIDTSDLGDDQKDVRHVFAMPAGIWAFASTRAYFRPGAPSSESRWEQKDLAPAADQIRSVVRTATDELVAFTDGGVYTLDARGWTQTDPTIEESSDVALGPDGTLYLGRTRGKVDRFRREGGRLIAMPAVQVDAITLFAETISVDRRGRIWQGDSKGAYVTEGDRTTVLSKSTPLVAGMVERLLVIDGGPVLR